MICSIVLFVLLGLSLLVIFSQLLASAVHVTHGGGPMASRTREVGPRLDEAILEDNDSSTKIAVLDVNGIITSAAVDQQGTSMVDIIKAQLDRAQEDARVKAVILRVDSPGGEVLASDEISDAIKNFQNGKMSNGEDATGHHHGKPVIVSMGNLAASGGYYISAPCRWIVANKMTLTGSIGVIMHGWNYRGLIDKIGIAPETYKSGKFKDMLSGSRATNEIPAEEHAMVQKLIDEVYTDFKDVVAEGRKAAHNASPDGQALADDWANYADGRVLSGVEARKLGFVDEIGDFRTAVKRAKTIAGINTTTDVNLIRYEQRYDISDIFRMFGESKTDAHTVKVDLGFDAPKLQAGEIYFLSPVLFH
jgi:protease-4